MSWRLRYPLVSIFSGIWLIGGQLSPGQAAPVDVDLELVLATDVSESMDPGKLQLQRAGYVAAFRDAELVQALESGPLGKIAVTYFNFAGPDYQTVIVPWTILSNQDDAKGVADKLEAAPILGARSTSISSALLFAAAQFVTSGARGSRRTIDISGDGPNNTGGFVEAARDIVVEQGIIINGLPINIPTPDLRRPTTRIQNPNRLRIDYYYEDCVIGGGGSFVISVDALSLFAEAIRRKLILEIAKAQQGLIPAAFQERTKRRGDCLAGERGQ